jgi:hypothetical protein
MLHGMQFVTVRDMGVTRCLLVVPILMMPCDLMMVFCSMFVVFYRFFVKGDQLWMRHMNCSNNFCQLTVSAVQQQLRDTSGNGTQAFAFWSVDNLLLSSSSFAISIAERAASILIFSCGRVATLRRHSHRTGA